MRAGELIGSSEEFVEHVVSANLVLARRDLCVTLLVTSILEMNGEGAGVGEIIKSFG